MTRDFLEKLIEDGSCEKALPRIVQMRRDNPHDPGLAMMEGVCRTDMGDYSEAVRVMAGAVDRMPGYLDGHAHLVFSLARLGRVSEAEQRAREILRDPKAGPFALVKAAEGLTHRRTGLARQLVKKAILGYPDEPLPWLAWSCLLSMRSRPAGAMAALNCAQKLDPRNPFMHELAFWYQYPLNTEAALSHALRIPLSHFQSPVDVAAVLDLARKHLQKGDPRIRGIVRRLQALRRSRAGQAQELIHSVMTGAY